MWRSTTFEAGPFLAAGPDFAACPNLGNGSFAAVPGLCSPKVGLHIGLHIGLH